jgi:hypothetical protein
MADLARKTTGRDQGTAQAPDVQLVDGTQESNSELQQELGSSGSGLANYQSALGSWLGGELHGAVADQLTMESLRGFADKGLSEAIQALVGTAADQADTVDEAAVERFAEALAGRFDGLAGEWLEQNGGGLQQSLAGWVDAHPRTIAAVGLLAAAGAVLADMDVPTLKKKFGLTDALSARLSAKLGSLQDVALQEIKAQLEYTSGPLIAAVQVSHGEDGTNGRLEGSYKGDDWSVKGNVVVTEDGIDAWGLSGLYGVRQGLTLSAAAQQASGQDPTVNASITHVDGSMTNRLSTAYDANSGTLSLSGLHRDDWGEISAMVNSKGDASVEGRWDQQWGQDWKTRVQQRVGYQDGDMEYETTGLAAYRLQEGVQIFGGASYRDDAEGARFIPEVGAQIDGVPISIQYDTGSDTISVGVRFKF